MPVETPEFIAMLRRMIRAAGRRAAEGDEIELRDLISLRADLTAAITTAVHGQRDHGRSWTYIASATGTTRQGAQQRWSKPAPPTDSTPPAEQPTTATALAEGAPDA